ncbi:hypothetical protein ACFL00_05450 [Pseudomonadota bacterium]
MPAVKLDRVIANKQAIGARMVQMKLHRLGLSVVFSCLIGACSSTPPNGNRPPVISAITSTAQFSNQTKSSWQVVVEASDPDNDPITLTFSDIQPGIQHLDTGFGRATVEVLNTTAIALVQVRVIDGQGGEAVNRFDVRGNNQSPILALHSADSYILTTTDQTSIHALATDADNDPITFSTTLSQGAGLATLSGGHNTGGIYNIKLSTVNAPPDEVRVETRVMDGKGGEAISKFDVKVGRGLALADYWPTPGFGPYALGLDGAGRLYVSNITNGIIVFNANGSRATALDLTLPASITIRALLVDASVPGGRIIIGQENGYFAGRMLAFDLQGNALPDLPIDSTTIPHYMVARADGTWVISDNHGYLKHYNPVTNVVIATWGGNGSGQFQYTQPRQISINPVDGSMFVADRGNNRIKHTAAGGTYLNQWSSTPVGMDIPHGVLYDPASDKVIVGDTGNDRLLVFTPDGIQIQELPLPAGAQPRYIVVGSDGRFYIPSYSHQKIYIAQFQ